jgi:TIR domain-containing protein
MDIFISYRRQDTSGYALGLRREFTQSLSSVHVFLDSASLDPGVRWREEIRRRLSLCEVMLVLIGDEWLITRDGQKKIEQENDSVHFELELVLGRNGIMIIPILLEEAKMPSPLDLPLSVRGLCEYEAHAIHDRTYDHDVNRLIERLTTIADELPNTPVSGPHPPLSPPDPASFPARITGHYLQREVSGMGQDQLRALMAELRRRGWSEEEIYDRALKFSPLQPPSRLPARITPAWLATNVPLLSPNRIRHLTTELRRRGWSSDEIRTHVFEHHQNGLAEAIPARIQPGWLERNAPLMTVAEQNRLAQVMLARGWPVEDVRHHLPEAQILQA